MSCVHLRTRYCRMAYFSLGSLGEVVSFLAYEGGFETRTHRAHVVCGVFEQLLFPGESFLIWYDIPDEDATTAAQKVCRLQIYRLVRMCCGSTDKTRAT